MKIIKNLSYSNARNFQNYHNHNLVNKEEMEVVSEEDVMDLVVAEEMDLEEEEAVADSALTEMEEDKEATVSVGKVTDDLKNFYIFVLDMFFIVQLYDFNNL